MRRDCNAPNEPTVWVVTDVQEDAAHNCCTIVYGPLFAASLQDYPAPHTGWDEPTSQVVLTAVHPLDALLAAGLVPQPGEMRIIHMALPE